MAIPATYKVLFLQGGASDVHPAVGILRIDLGDFFEGRLRGFQIALQHDSENEVLRRRLAELDGLSKAR